MAYWTFDNQNGLEGVEGTFEVLEDCNPGRVLYHPDPDEPAVLPDDTILYALRTSRAARGAFREEFPNLDADSQERLTALLEENPRESALQLDDQAFADRVQSQAVRSIPVRTAGRRGGKGGHGA